VQSQDEKNLWQERWQKGQTGWDQGGAHPGLRLLIAHARREGALPEQARFYSAGCGSAHSEAELARQGYRVKAVDVSPSAIKKAKELYGDRTGLELSHSDLFRIEECDIKSYDAIYDRAMLCALAPENRPAYIEAMKARLGAGGLFCAILFRAVKVQFHPPYPVDEQEVWRLLSKDFVLCYAATLPGTPVPAGIKEEWICIWRLRGAL